MKSLQVALPVAALLAGTAAAQAQSQAIEGIYVGAGAGYDILQNSNGTVDAIAGPSGIGFTDKPAKVGWNGGYAVSGSVGYGLGNGVRLEAEGDFRGVGQNHGGGSQQQYGLMGNILYDINVGLPWMTPYLGVGVGYQNAAWNNVALTAHGIAAGSGPTSVSANQSLGGVAAQAIVGVAFPVESVPGLAVTAEYRFQDMFGARSYRATGVTPSASGSPSVGDTRVRVSDDINQSVMLGLRYAFGAPETMAAPAPLPPAPAAKAVPAPVRPAARTYLVFFDWDKADLTPRARDIIAEAVRNSARISYTRIEVAGNTDLSGSPAYNQALSLKRAQAVAAELEKWGVARSAIMIHAFGDTKPLVPTSAGVRQPENRRVEIVYQ